METHKLAHTALLQVTVVYGPDATSTLEQKGTEVNNNVVSQLLFSPMTANVRYECVSCGHL